MSDVESCILYFIYLKIAVRDFQEINYPILWGGHLARLWLLGGRDAHPTINSWIFFYLEVPNLTEEYLKCFFYIQFFRNIYNLPSVPRTVTYVYY